jgi:hypothetical protein
MNTTKTKTAAKSLSVATTATVTAEPTKAQIRAWFDEGRAANIIAIMKRDGIEYARAVKRSRRRMINEGVWA